jgi:hypothetical protein
MVIPSNGVAGRSILSAEELVEELAEELAEEPV